MKQVLRLFQIVSLVVVFMSVSATPSLAQGTLRGNVIDSQGEPLIGATVVMKGKTSVATVTDFDGNFVLNTSVKKATLLVSYVGMVPQEVVVTEGRVVKVVLKDDDHTLQETVIIGYGQQKKASVVGSITQADAKVLSRTGGISSLGAALTGNLPGVITMSSSGMPGDEDPKILIRGVNTWNNSEPLVLVDGIERPMGSIDIASVQNISVLKDASATAVYGVRGANGVILITTKRGEEGKAKIEIGMQMTAKVVSKLPNKMNSADALTVRNQAAEYELGLSPESWSKVLPMSTIEKYRNPANLEEAERYPNVDWTDELFNKSAISYNPNINVSGGTAFVKYFASLDFLHEGDLYRKWDNNRGYTAGYGFNRINIRSNLDFQLSKTTKLKVNLFGSNGVKQGPYGVVANSWAETQLWQAAYSAPSDAFIPRYSDGTWGYYPNDTQGAPNSITNLALAGVCKTTNTRINTDFTLEQDLGFILKGLKANATISWDNSFIENNRGINDQNHGAQFKWINPETGEVTYAQKQDSKTGFDFNEGILWKIDKGTANVGNRNLFYQGQLFWGGKFGKHDVTAMGVFNRNETAYGSEFTHYREDWAFRATYSYASRYFLEYNGCYNGSEKFSKDNRFVFFNSGAAGWLVSEENWFKPLKKYVDMLKFRYSYGEVGNDWVGDRWLYATQWAYGSTGPRISGQSINGLYTDDSPYTWYKEYKIGNPSIHWEVATKQNFGVDYSFLGGLIAGSLEFFNENRHDILVDGGDRSIPTYFGAKAPTDNLGKTKSHGYEFELRLSKTISGVHLWGNFNMTHAVNKIIFKDDPVLKPAYQKQAGYAIGQDHANLTTGFANTWDQVYGMTEFNTNDNQKLPGSYTVIDYNGDGVIDSNDSAPYGYTGTPENTYSASIGAEWKGWSFYVQFYGVSNVNRYVAFNSLGKKLDTVFDEGTLWSKYTMDADAPMPRINSTPSYNEGTRFHYDGSFIRLKNAEIAYNFTGPWIKKLGVNSIRVFLNGNNLWVWSRMPDDRESNFAGTGLASQGAYPTVKRFNLGLKINL